MGFWSKLFGKKQTKPEVEEWIDDDPEVPETPAVKTTTTTTTTTTKAKAAKPPVTKKAPGKVAKDLEPQCAALTAKGDQCKRSSRVGSKYCGSHKNYKPKTAAKQTDAKDTKPVVAKAKDTAPATRKAAAKPKANDQCAAVTAAGSQCKSASRDNSKYCGRHKGYRAPAKAAKPAAKKAPAKKATTAKKAPAKKASTAKKPAAKKAPAKKPAAKKPAAKNGSTGKTQVSEGDYKLFQNGNRFYFSKQTQAEAKKKGGAPVYKMPAGRKVVKTANGLPVLKKA